MPLANVEKVRIFCFSFLVSFVPVLVMLWFIFSTIFFCFLWKFWSRKKIAAALQPACADSARPFSPVQLHTGTQIKKILNFTQKQFGCHEAWIWVDSNWVYFLSGSCEIEPQDTLTYSSMTLSDHYLHLVNFSHDTEL